jgi:phosphatidylglycerophosphate synthase
MTTSTNDPEPDTPPDTAGGAIADALTLLRLFVTPLIMALVLFAGWPDPQISILACFLFIIAAVSDILDDVFGGSSRNAVRRYGYLDDAADTILVTGVLTALTIVVWRSGLMHWAFLIPVAVLILREVAVGVFKGYELSRFGWDDDTASNLKGGFAMLGTMLLVGAPWLTQALDRLRAGPDRALEVYGAVSPALWIVGQICLWIAALFSLVTGYKILTHKRETPDV